MNSMTALMKREFLDHKGAMLWAPLVIGGLLIIAIIWGAASVPLLDGNWQNIPMDDKMLMEGNGTVTESDGTVITRSSRKLADGREEVTVIVKDKSGKQVSKVTLNRKPGADVADHGKIEIGGKNFESPRDAVNSLNAMPTDDRRNGAHMLGSGLFAGAAILPLLLALLMTPFILLASLYDERQDRSILFWKSLPVSDTKVVITKLVFGALLTFGIAFAVGMFVHLVALVTASALGAEYGVVGVGALWYLPNLFNTWGTWALVVLQYILWALPIYAWFLLVSAFAPRAPFLFAFMIPAALGMLEGLWHRTGYFAGEFFGRLGGAPMIESIEALSVNTEKLRDPAQFLALAQKAVFNGFAQPGLWIGIAIAAVLLYATIEIRRRKTL